MYASHVIKAMNLIHKTLALNQLPKMSKIPFALNGTAMFALSAPKAHTILKTKSVPCSIHPANPQIKQPVSV